MIDGDILFAVKGGLNILADKLFTNKPGVGMRIAHAMHIGHHRIQQIVTPGNGQRQRLDESALRRQRQGLLHFRHIGERASNRQRRIFYAVAGGIADLYKPQRVDQQQYRTNHAANHERHGGTQLHTHQSFARGRN